jgi:DNA-binding transcriptional regulator PaaX
MDKHKNKKEKYNYAIAKSILNQSITATAWLLSSMFEIGAITIETFLSPSFYGDPGNLFFDNTPKTSQKTKYKEITIRQSLRRLEKYGFVERNGSKYKITIKGKIFLKGLLSQKNNRKKPWDEKYRVVIFDIPESMRKSRNWLRVELGSLGYKKLQQSVFIGKKPLSEDIIIGIKENKLNNYVNYLLVDKVYKNIL